MSAEGVKGLSLARLGSSKWTGNAERGERVAQCLKFTHNFSTILY
jgi:hypothetical protein